MPEHEVGFEGFRTSWLEDVTEGTPSTVDLGRRFALKLVTQWLDASDATNEVVYCDGAGDGGIDLAILDIGADEEGSGNDQAGDAWYLVQSKYGSAFAGAQTLLIEGQKVIETLDGKRTNLNSLAAGLLERLTHFRSAAGPNDKIILVFGTERPLNEEQQRALQDLRVMGRERLGGFFDVETISIETIFSRLDEEPAAVGPKLTVTIPAKMVPSGKDLLVGSVKLVGLYSFLLDYRRKTGDLDQIYEKNVRRFLGGRGKVNRAMQATLKDAPERFGLYNNGITLVVSDYVLGDETVELIEPYIVNGCQTSRTIWEVCHQRLGSGGTGINPEIEAWKLKAAEGAVVTKIVKVGQAGEVLLQAITRYTNSQNAVREKDFLALTSDFKTWQGQLAERYGIYFEIQRGGWDSQKALQYSNPKTVQFEQHVNAADLIKVFGAGWLGEAGLAFGKNPPFLPDGAVFKRIVTQPEDGQEAFGAADLYAAYLLQAEANAYGFGRGAKITRRQSRFLFYSVVIDLLRDAMTRAQLSTELRHISEALTRVLGNEAAKGALLDQAIEVIDAYFTQGTEDCVFDEPAMSNSFNGDLNAFMKWEKLGKSEDATPRLRSALAINKQVMGRGVGGMPSPRALIIEAASAVFLPT